MRQLAAFLETCHKRNTTLEWSRSNFLASLQGAEIKPLEEILGVDSNDEESAFDPETDRILEERAQRILKQGNLVKNV